jgi:helix-turn-helix protein
VTYNRGSKNGRAKLTEKLVLAIIREHYTLTPQMKYPSRRFLAKKYGISEKQVRRILSGECWRHTK